MAAEVPPFPRSPLSEVTQPLDHDDLRRIREASSERLEIIAGELFATPSSTLTHQVILGHLSSAAWRTIDDAGLGLVFHAMLDVRLAADSVVLPDLMVILSDRQEILAEWGIDGVPSLLAEVLSDHAPWREQSLKRRLYAWYGVPEYWIVDPEGETVTILSDPRDGEYQLELVAHDNATSATIPSLSIELSKLFAVPFAKRNATGAKSSS